MAYPGRRTVDIANRGHLAAHSPGHDIASLVVLIRSRLAEGGYRYHDDAGINLLQVGISQTDAVQVTGCVSLDNEVGALYQLFKDFPAIGGRDIEGYSSFTGIQSKPEKTFLRVRLVMVERPQVAGGVTAWSLDLDYVCPQVSEYLTRQKTFLIGQVQYPVRAEHTFRFRFTGHTSASLHK